MLLHQSCQVNMKAGLMLHLSGLRSGTYSQWYRFNKLRRLYVDWCKNKHLYTQPNWFTGTLGGVYFWYCEQKGCFDVFLLAELNLGLRRLSRVSEQKFTEFTDLGDVFYVRNYHQWSLVQDETHCRLCIKWLKGIVGNVGNCYRKRK